MFDIGFLELAIIFVLGIVIIGPERMPEAVRGVMRVWGRIKHTLSETRSEFEKQIGADDIRRELHNERVLKALEKTQAKAQEEFKAISDRADLNAQKSLSDEDRTAQHGEKESRADAFAEEDNEEYYNEYHAAQHDRQELEASEPLDGDVEPAEKQQDHPSR